MKSPTPELIELCGAVRDECVTPEQIARLEALFANDPQARRFYRQFMQISATLERYEQFPAAAPKTTEAKVIALPRTARSRLARLRPWLTLAACFVLLAVIYYTPVSGPPSTKGPTPVAILDEPLAIIQEARRCVVIPRNGPPIDFIGGYHLRGGDIVTTSADGSAIVRFANETTLFVLSADTRAWVSREGASKLVHLASGQFYADVAPQSGGQQWRILTADGEVRVLGTRLAVSAQTGGTRVAVSFGRVLVTARDSRQSVETRAGFAAQLTPTTATLVKLSPTEPMRVASFTLVDADTNAPIASYEQVPDGAVIDLARLPTRQLNVRANCEPQLVGMVRFEIAGTDAAGQSLELVHPVANGFPSQIEIYYPYMLAGDPSIEGERLPQHSYPWTPPVGRYTLTAAPYADKKQWGARGEPLSIRFEVIDTTR